MKTRTLGETFPISIGSAIPFEKLEELKTLKNYNSLYISIETLVRNAIGSIEDKNSSVNDVYDIVMDDIKSIGRFIKQHHPKLTIFLYSSTYKSLSTVFPFNKRILPVTEKQRVFDTLLKSVEALVRKAFSDIIIIIDCHLIPEKKYIDALVLTAFPVELLENKRFGQFALLESHTGAVKTRLELNTKLTQGTTHLNMPFNRFTLSVFGDNNKLIRCLDKATRDMVEGIADSGNWTADSKQDLLEFHIKGKYTLPNKEDLLSLL